MSLAALLAQVHRVCEHGHGAAVWQPPEST